MPKKTTNRSKKGTQPAHSKPKIAKVESNKKNKKKNGDLPKPTSQNLFKIVQ